MAINKNQHFVPRCHLKPFSLDGQGLAINLYNLNSQRLIINAPVKSQCSRDYFYGKDQELEMLIQSLESNYASVVRRLHDNPAKFQAMDISFLSYFWMFQHLRTETIQKSILKHSADVQKAVGEDIPNLNIEKRHATMIALSAFAENSDAISDLNMILIKNSSSTPFLTSDNPAVLTNRWALYKPETTDATFGMYSAGIIAILPITQSLLVMLYDKDIYSIQHQNNIITVNKDVDIMAINEHQYLNCATNLYLGSAFTMRHIQDFPDLTEHRKLTGPKIHVFQKKNNEDHKYYAAKGFDRSKGTDALMAVSTFYAKPTRWPEFLRWRSGGFYFTNGSGVGPIRKACITIERAHRPFQKLRTGH